MSEGLRIGTRVLLPIELSTPKPGAKGKAAREEAAIATARGPAGNRRFICKTELGRRVEIHERQLEVIE